MVPFFPSYNLTAIWVTSLPVLSDGMPTLNTSSPVVIVYLPNAPRGLAQKGSQCHSATPSSLPQMSFPAQLLAWSSRAIAVAVWHGVMQLCVNGAAICWVGRQVLRKHRCCTSLDWLIASASRMGARLHFSGVSTCFLQVAVFTSPAAVFAIARQNPGSWSLVPHCA